MLNSYLFVKLIEDEKDDAGLVYTSDQKNKCFKGKVLNGEYEGKIVYFSEYAGEEMHLNGIDGRILNVEDLICVEE